jgi:hypothetical protein
MKKHRFAVAAIAAATVGLPSYASATAFQCRCLDAFAPAVAAGKLNKDGNTFRCSATWSTEGSGNNTDNYNSYVKLYFNEGKSSDNITTIGVRPRKSSECLNAVYDKNNEKLEWGGGYCDTSNAKNVGGMDLVKTSDGSMRMVAGSANTTSKKNKFTAFYLPKADGNYLQAACVEDK